ncbi:MAG TPA: hypothetical protein VLH16_01400, partial [Bacteroidales bacterium]|nr:hypothetical protein [Bacteroidales bacterium]
HISAGNDFAGRLLFDQALNEFRNALIIKPKEKYPAQRIGEIEEMQLDHARRQQDYIHTIRVADSLFNRNLYQEALTEYLFASGLLPSENHPRQRIDAINKIIEQARAEQLAFEQAVSKGDQLFMALDFAAALEAYTQALKIRPSERYPAGMIERIRTQQAEAGTIEEQYNAVIQSADQLFAAGEFETARLSYQRASRLKPAETYPRNRIAEINKLLVQAAQNQEIINNALQEADNHYRNQRFELALENYRIAHKHNPADQQTALRISQLELLIGTGLQVRRSLQTADSLFDAKAYALAIIAYQEVLKLETNHKHSQNRITAINSILSQLEQNEAEFNELITNANRLYNENKLQEALEKYRLAEKQKPGDAALTARINEISDRIQEALKRQAAFDILIATADAHFVRNEYALALTVYQEASAIDPENSYPAQRITEIRNLINAAELDNAYSEAVAEALAFESQNNLPEALESWQRATGFKPEETQPQERIRQINTQLTAERLKARDAYEAAIATGNRYFETKVLDQAIEAFQEAARLLPHETLPGEMIARIRQLINERTLINLVKEPVALQLGEEKRFSFEPVEMRARRNNYVIIRLNFGSTAPSRVFLNFGVDQQRSGGIVVRNPGGKTENEFIIRVSAQDRWYRIDNNWVGVLSDGNTAEITQLIIAAGE